MGSLHGLPLIPKPFDASMHIPSLEKTKKQDYDYTGHNLEHMHVPLFEQLTCNVLVPATALAKPGWA
jgi:hypothetical protein